ncbi:DNA repair nuclease [Faustovirus]|nr:DNA repair nuclease [Faustovirus]
MNVIEHELATKLVALYLYDKNIHDYGGEVKDGKLIKPGNHGCLLAHHDINSNILLWWRCENYPNHVYHYHKMSVNDKIATLGQGCDKCRKLVIIKDKFSSVDGVQECWNWEKNTITPDKLATYCNNKFTFICELGHEFRRPCSKFVRGDRCSFCSGRKVLAGFNSFDLSPNAIEWWDTEENDKLGLKIDSITKYSSKEAVFKCPLGHKFKMACGVFTSGNRCGVCSGQIVLVGFNSFDLSPNAIEWWDTEENDKLGLKIDSITRFTHMKVNLRCPLGHKYKALCSDFSNGKRCPVCASKQLLEGFNTFSSIMDVKEWWDTEENDKHGIIANKISQKSTKMVAMKCPKSHKFKIRCSHFTNGVRCKICSLSGCSKIAVEYIECIAKKYNIFIQHGKNVGEYDIPGTRYSADGYVEINSVKIIIEFHGEVFHGFRGLKRQDELSPFEKKKTFGDLYQQTIKKENTIRELGYKLIVMWEDDYKELRDDYMNGNFTIPIIENALNQ